MSKRDKRFQENSVQPYHSESRRIIAWMMDKKQTGHEGQQSKMAVRKPEKDARRDAVRNALRKEIRNKNKCLTRIDKENLRNRNFLASDFHYPRRDNRDGYNGAATRNTDEKSTPLRRAPKVGAMITHLRLPL